MVFVHHLIDRGLVDLIWLIEARKKALSGGRWVTKRGNPPVMTGGRRIGRFAELASEVFIDVEAARTTIGRLVGDLNEANRFRDTLVHGRWGGHTDEQLSLFDAKQAKWMQVTQKALNTRSGEAFGLYLRLRDFDVWVTEQNAGLTKLREQRRAIIRPLGTRTNRTARRLAAKKAVSATR